MKTIAILSLISVAALAQTHPLEQLIDAARRGPSAPGLADLVTKTLTPRGGTAVWGQDYLFVTESKDPASISIDHLPALPMAQIGSSSLWMRLEKMRTGVTHSYEYFAAGKPLGARSDVTGYNPDSYPKTGVPRGVLSEKHTLTSSLYDGMKYDLWFYASPGVDPKARRPSCSGKTARLSSRATSPACGFSPSPRTSSTRNYPADGARPCRARLPRLTEKPCAPSSTTR